MPDVNIVQPNGGETINGVYDINWEVSDSDNNLVLDVSLFYRSKDTNNSWQINKGEIQIAESFCEFPDGEWIFDSSYTVGLPKSFPQPKISVMVIEGILYMLDINPNDGATRGYRWFPSVNKWAYHDDINKGLHSNIKGYLEYLDINEEHWLIYSLSPNDFRGKKWNGFEWENANYITKGIYMVPAQTLNFGYIDFNGKSRLIQSGANGSVARTYDWNGTEWTDTNSLLNGLQDLDNLFRATPQEFGLAPWIGSDGNLHMIVSDTDIQNSAHTVAQLMGLDWNGTQWAYNADLNKNIKDFELFGEHYSFPEIFYHLGKRYLMIGYSKATTEDGNYQSHHNEDLNTNNQISCTLPWDTVSVENGEYFLDINVFDGGSETIKTSQSFFTVDNPTPSDINKVGERCRSIIMNGPRENKIDFAFIGSGFPSTNKFAEVTNELIDYNGTANGLMSMSPFSDDKNKFNFWRADLNQTYTDPLSGTLDKEKALDDLENNCPFMDQYVVLTIKPRFRGHVIGFEAIEKTENKIYLTLGEEYLQNCYSTDPNCSKPWPLELDANSSIGNRKRDRIRSFIHEVGHSLGWLADEYVPKNAGDAGFDSPYKNCTEDSSCTEWNGIYSGITCDQNCKHTDWYRPFEETIMRSSKNTLTEFRAVSEDALTSRINDETSQLKSTANWFYIFTVNIQNTVWTWISTALRSGVVYESPSRYGNYTVRVKGDESIISDHNIIVGTRIFYEPLDNAFDSNGYIVDENIDERVEDMNDFNYTIRVPYNFNADTIEIVDENGVKVLSVDVTDLSPLKYSIVDFSSRKSSQNYNLVCSSTSFPIGKKENSNYKLYIGELYYSQT